MCLLPSAAASTTIPSHPGLLLLFGGLRGPAKPISRMLAAWPWPLTRPPGTGIGWPLPLELAMAALEDGCRRARAGRCAFCGGLEAYAAAGGFNWWAKGPLWRCDGGGNSWWGCSSAGSGFVGANAVVMVTCQRGLE